MASQEGEFWDQRYALEGAIWGEGPSPTAALAARHLAPGEHILDAGCGYGRDLEFLALAGFQVSGIDLSHEARSRACERLAQHGVSGDRVRLGQYEETEFPEAPFAGILSHRVTHLYLTQDKLDRFVWKTAQLLKPGGLLCLGARNQHDLNPEQMQEVEAGVFEYRDRPGHRIRYWSDQSFQDCFGAEFAIHDLVEVQETESARKPVPCHCTVMIARKKT